MDTINVRIRLPKSTTPQYIKLSKDACWMAVLLQLQTLSGINVDRIRVLHSYPPKPIETRPQTTVQELHLRQNDMLIIQEGQAQVHIENSGGKYALPASEKAHLTRRICPGDNSCLFHACAYILRNKNRTDGPALRQECVDVVRAHPQKYNVNTIGQNTQEYAQWLSWKDAWGGAIELQILSELYKTQLIALDLESTTMQWFGQNCNYPVRGFVVYTGTHFDSIAMNPHYNSDNEQEDQVLFNTRDAKIITLVKRFVQEEGEKMRAERAIKKSLT